MRRWIFLTILAGVAIAAGLTPSTFASAGQDSQAQAQGEATADDKSLYDSVAEQLLTRYVDEEFRENKLPALVERYRPLAEEAETLNEQREAVQALLRNIPATHLGLFSQTSFDRLMRELRGRSGPSLGFEVLELDGKHFVHNLLEGGPGEKAGLKRGDRIIAVNGELIEQSPRLDWRTDDAYLEDDAVTALLVEADETLSLEIERTWGETQTIDVPVEVYSTWEAAKASARIIERDGRKLAYVHFWLIHISGIPAMLKEKLEGEFADCDALVLDLRGRGGNGNEIQPMLQVLSGESSDWDKPVVALIDNESRSAKEVISYEIRKQNLATLVGERTAGAVIPATFVEVGHDSVLMFPTFRLGNYTTELEGVGVEPHVVVERAGPYSNGHDPILEAGIAEALKKVIAHSPEVPSSQDADGGN